jgi:hypothetical protein
VILERSAREDRKEGFHLADSAALALAIYAALTIALTWPLARGLTHDLPGDFGDPLFTTWAIAWGATHLGHGWWSANIFAPHPLALAYSEHFLPQALQALPIYAATRNPILCYNLLFLSTFVVSGLGMFLFARELTASPSAAFVAGLAFAFAPYRIASIPHLQVLSSAWMPFVLYGLRRYFVTRRAVPLAGAAGAWILQNLSCGYYLLFFTPIVLAYIAWELTTRALWRDRATLWHVAAACAAVGIVTLPFLLPYLEIRRLGFNPRSIAETRRFSADVYAYATADPNLRVWGRVLQSWPHAEGLLFPGFTIVALALTAVVTDAGRRDGGRGGAESVALRLAGALFACVVVALLLGYSIRLPGVRIASLSRVAGVGVAAAALVLALSRSVRAATAAWLRTPAAWLALVTLFAIAMSFGPDIHAKGRSVANANIYALFYAYVPGFDGLRVPARYAMIAALALAALAGIGVAALAPPARSAERPQATSLTGAVPWIAGALIVFEAVAVPIPINQNATDYKDSSLAPLPASIATGASAPPVYRFIARLPPSAVIIELPLGEPAFDIRYMFYSTTHWRRLVNGYSGGAPGDYEFLAESLSDTLSRPERAWQGLVASTATHVVVHEAFYKGNRGLHVSGWLRAHGAREVVAFDSDRVFARQNP